MCKLGRQVPYSAVVLVLVLALLTGCTESPSKKQRGAVEQELSCGGITTIRFYDIKEFDRKCIAILEEQRTNNP